MNVQSQSFPDLSKQTIGKTGHYTQNRINANSNKSSKLPVASRYLLSKVIVSHLEQNDMQFNDTDTIPFCFKVSINGSKYRSRA